ncbi:CBS domain-containing protein [Ferrimonas aestuarii]|uniref:CBS domain-containing protein n=1 Tax=Ferrimonas aestuarii TaxID=2569539 RepID=A0A4U1BX45_9GAMM|nr:CBS domain-containing protein [Ferrimonas aestuarii]TKB58295.1 CBS domain-containing protein [Ferrimonas aestuarii]
MTRFQKVADYMHPPKVVLAPTQTITDALAIMQQSQAGWAPVVDSRNQLVGVLTEHDLLIDLWCCDYRPSMDLTVQELMQQQVVALSPRDLIRDLAEQICIDVEQVYPTSVMGRATALCSLSLKERVRQSKPAKPHQYPVVENGQLVGTMSRHDLLRALSPLYGESVAKAS